MKHLGTSVDKFFRVGFSHVRLSPSLIELLPQECEASDHAPNGGWKIGPSGITRHHIKVIGAVHVSAGSWMPIIQLTEYVF
jgi:hypothetical protein